MATYTVKRHQNIYDVAIHAYGSIEGIFDLLISNPLLSYDDDLVEGQELTYHTSYLQNEAVLDKMEEESWVPVNGERDTYYKACDTAMLFYCKTDAGTDRVTIVVSGSGTLYIDWGDDTDIEVITLSGSETTITHAYDVPKASYVVKIHSEDAAVTTLDVTEFSGDMYLLSSLQVDEFTCNKGDMDLTFLSLFTDTYYIDLSGMKISSLEGIYDMNLMTLDLRDVDFSDISVLDAYFEYIVNNFTIGDTDRQDCTIYLSEKPSEDGEAAIEKLLRGDGADWEIFVNKLQYMFDAETDELFLCDVSGAFPYSFIFALGEINKI